MTMSQLDQNQILRTNYDDTNNTLQVFSQNSIVISKFDYIGVAYPDSVTETYTYKTGGSGGTTVATITVVYTDSSKASISSVART